MEFRDEDMPMTKTAQNSDEFARCVDFRYAWHQISGLSVSFITFASPVRCDECRSAVRAQFDKRMPVISAVPHGEKLQMIDIIIVNSLINALHLGVTLGKYHFRFACSLHISRQSGVPTSFGLRYLACGLSIFQPSALGRSQ
jgi:hypothetical protein